MFLLNVFMRKEAGEKHTNRWVISGLVSLGTTIHSLRYLSMLLLQKSGSYALLKKQNKTKPESDKMSRRLNLQKNVQNSSYESRVTVRHLTCGQSRLRCSLNVNYTPDLEDLEKKSANCLTNSINYWLHVGIIKCWTCWFKIKWLK